MPIFGILIYLILAGLFAGAWCASFGIFWLARWRKWVVVQWLAAGAFVLLTVLGVSIAGLFGYGYYRSVTPRLVYEDTFREKPTADVHELRGRAGSFFDSAGIDLSFRCAPDTFARIRQRRDPALERASSKEIASYLHGRQWPPETEFYLSAPPYGKAESFAHEVTVMTFDPATGQAEFHWEGID